ncbi:MAG: ECF transporter S component [Anaerolineales bacterium]|nr:MAG: ECF transporter S component [Anaerolineales bacterium]
MTEKSINIRSITLIALMAAMVFVLTVIPRFPVPATGGYIHLGDAGVIFAACAFGPGVAMAAGGLGTALADLMGYPQWAIFSLLVHGLQGFIVGLVLRRKLNAVNLILSAVFSILIVTGGYFISGVILEGAAVAAIEILPNTLQALSGSLVGIPLYLAVRQAYPPINRFTNRAK